MVAWRRYCPDGSGSQTVVSLNLPAASYEIDAFSQFHCYAGAAACTNSPLNTCGPRAPNTTASGTTCVMNFVNGLTTYSPCTFTDTSVYNYYCPDGSDGIFQVDPVSGALCYVSTATCNNSPVNSCPGAPGPSCTYAKNTSVAGCQFVDTAFAWSCPVGASASPAARPVAQRLLSLAAAVAVVGAL